MENTFITLHRKILQSSCFQDAELLKLWLWCLMRANHKDREIIHGGQLVRLKRGQFITGRYVATKELNMTTMKYRGRIALLAKMLQISLKVTNKYTIITVVNYDLYQTKGKKITNKQPTDNQQITTDNNVNNVNNTTSDKSPTMPFNKNKEEAVVDYDSGELVEPVKPQTKKYPNAPKVYKVFQAELGKLPANWRINKTQLLSAENLYTERGIPAIENALRYYKENKEAEYIPFISSPFDLDSKWSKLANHKNKQS